MPRKGKQARLQALVTFSCPEEFRERLNRYVRAQGDQNRSRVIREAIEGLLSGGPRSTWNLGEGEKKPEKAPGPVDP